MGNGYVHRHLSIRYGRFSSNQLRWTEGRRAEGGDERHTDDDKVERLSRDVLDGSRHRCNAQFTTAATALVTKVAAIPNSESERSGVLSLPGSVCERGAIIYPDHIPYSKGATT